MKTIQKSDRPETNETLFAAKFDGNKTRTLAKFYRKIAKRFDFPEHFGNNMDALYDCLTDLSWIKQNKVKLFIKNIDGFLSKETEETKGHILEIFADAADNQLDDENSFEVISVLDSKHT